VSRSDEPDPGRLVGVRIPYAAVPDAVKAWAAETLGGPVVDIRPRVGGMSPAMAASLRAGNGRTVFVKAVGTAVNPDTPTHFRHEIEVLTALPPAPYRAALLSTYDDGDWVGLALEDVDGRHPDWTSGRDRAAVYEAVRLQNEELTPVPQGLPPASNRVGISKYRDQMANASGAELAGLPAWAARRLPDLVDLVEACLDHHRDESFCHWDLRPDNILLRRHDGQPVLLDWGMSRRSQRWGDVLVFALEWVDRPEFDEIVSRMSLSAEEEADITGFLAGIGCFLLMSGTHPAPPGLPTMPEFRRRVGTACLLGVRRRLGT
jgi:serine/threonine protein kinase